MKTYDKIGDIEYCIEVKESKSGKLWICKIPEYNLYYSVSKGDIESKKEKGRAMIQSTLNFRKKRNGLTLFEKM